MLGAIEIAGGEDVCAGMERQLIAAALKALMHAQGNLEELVSWKRDMQLQAAGRKHRNGSREKHRVGIAKEFSPAGLHAGLGDGPGGLRFTRTTMPAFHQGLPVTMASKEPGAPAGG